MTSAAPGSSPERWPLDDGVEKTSAISPASAMMVTSSPLHRLQVSTLPNWSTEKLAAPGSPKPKASLVRAEMLGDPTPVSKGSDTREAGGGRQEERRGGKGCGHTGRYRG